MQPCVLSPRLVPETNPLTTFRPGHKRLSCGIYSAGPQMRHVGLQSVRGSIQTKSPRRQYIFPRFLKNFGFSSEKPQLHTLLCTGSFSHHVWWSQAGSNRRPPACKAGALPAELWPLTRLFVAWLCCDLCLLRSITISVNSLVRNSRASPASKNPSLVDRASRSQRPCQAKK